MQLPLELRYCIYEEYFASFKELNLIHASLKPPVTAKASFHADDMTWNASYTPQKSYPRVNPAALLATSSQIYREGWQFFLELFFANNTFIFPPNVYLAEAIQRIPTKGFSFLTAAVIPITASDLEGTVPNLPDPPSLGLMLNAKFKVWIENYSDIFELPKLRSLTLDVSSAVCAVSSRQYRVVHFLLALMPQLLREGKSFRLEIRIKRRRPFENICMALIDREYNWKRETL